MRENAYRLQRSASLFAPKATFATSEDILTVTKVLGEHWESEGIIDILRGSKPVMAVRPEKDGSVLDASTFAKPHRIFALERDAALEEVRYRQAVEKLRAYLKQVPLPPAAVPSYPAPPASNINANSRPPYTAASTSAVEWSVFSGPPRNSTEPTQPPAPAPLHPNLTGGFPYNNDNIDLSSLAHSAPDMFSKWLASDTVQDSTQPSFPGMNVSDPWQSLLVGSSGGINVEDMMHDLQYTTGF